MKVFAVIVGTGLTLALLASAAGAQELRLALAWKKHPVEHPTPNPKAIVREAERAVQEYEEQAARERVIEALQERDRQRSLDSLITQHKQALAIQRALRDLRR